MQWDATLAIKGPVFKIEREMTYWIIKYRIQTVFGSYTHWHYREGYDEKNRHCMHRIVARFQGVSHSYVKGTATALRGGGASSTQNSPSPPFHPNANHLKITIWLVKAPSSFSSKIARAFRRLLTTRFSKMTLTTRSALNVHEPYISHEIADSPFTRASFNTEALVS